MVRVTIVSKGQENLYGQMVQKELALRKAKRGTLHRVGKKKKDEDKWNHSSYDGWVRFQKCLGGVVVALIQARNDEDNQLLSSFIGFLDRHFRDDISSISISYEASEE